MQLADYLISLALSGKNVVVETHSDHIVNRLVRRLVEDETDQLKDLIAVYFVTATPEGSQHALVEIDGSKGIVNWPTDFFDQSATEQEHTIRAGLAKRKARRVLQS
jgi:predicted ATPase